MESLLRQLKDICMVYEKHSKANVCAIQSLIVFNLYLL